MTDSEVAMHDDARRTLHRALLMLTLVEYAVPALLRHDERSPVALR